MAKKKIAKEKKPKAKKVKDKSSGGGAQQFFIAHGEKLAVGVVGLVLLLLTFFAVTAETVPDDQLAGKIKQVAKEKTDLWVDHEAEEQAPPSYRLVLGKKRDVPPEAFAWSAPLSDTSVGGLAPPPVISLKAKRPEPKYAVAESVYVVSGHGYIADHGTLRPGDAGQKGDPGEPFKPVAGHESVAQHWNIVTALVPITKQTALYRSAFDQTERDMQAPLAEQDVPEYYRMIVERAEVVPGGSAADLQWRALNDFPAEQLKDDLRDPEFDRLIMEVWADILPGIVPRPFLMESMTYYNKYDFETWLPPIMVEGWRLWSVAHPQVARRVQDIRASAQQAPESADDGGRRSRDSGNYNAGDADEGPAMEAGAKEFGYKMLRYFDFNVEPGVAYQYRVRLVLRNPNRNFEERFLSADAIELRKKNGGLEADIFRTTEPSAASATARLPLDTSLVVVSIVQPTARVPEIAAIIRMTALVDVQAAFQKAIQEAESIRVKRTREAKIRELERLRDEWVGVGNVWADADFTVFRGAWLNLVGEANAVNPIRNADGQANGPMKLPGVEFSAGQLVVDINGGDPLSPDAGADFTEMAEVIAVDEAGSLMIYREAPPARPIAAPVADVLEADLATPGR